MTYRYVMPNAYGINDIVFQSSFNRVNVILGANGSGKSSILTFLRHNSQTIFGDLSPVYVEGGRAINIDIGLGIDNTTIQWVNNTKNASLEYKSSKRNHNITQRILRAFKLLGLLEQSEKAEHSDAVDAWMNAGSIGEAPKRRPPPLERLNIYFKRIFPELSITVNEHNQLFIKKGAHTYPASTMSDGEKQIFILLSDLVLLNEDKSLFLVDEPELNLHPTLADDFWSFLENEFPESVFIYATHSINFALRFNVDCINVIGFGNVEISDIDLSARHLQPFLGTLSRIKSKKFCLFVEGAHASFDKPFYRWLIGRDDVDIIPVGSSYEVILASSRQGLWKSLSADLVVAGVIDRDFKSDENLNAPENVVVLDYHEAESYLCHPIFLCKLNEALSNTSVNLTEDAIVDIMLNSARDRLIYVASQRVFSRTYIDLAVSVERSGLAKIDNIETLRRKLIAAASLEAQKAADRYSAEKISTQLDREIYECQCAIDNRDFNKLLGIFEGKRFLQLLCGKAGCAAPSTIMKAVAKHLSSDNFRHFDNLSQSLKDRFA